MNPIDKRFTDELSKIPSVTTGVIAYIKTKQQRNKSKQMKPTPIADIQQHKLMTFHQEMDILIINRMNKLSDDLLEGLKKEYDNLLFNSFESFEKGNIGSMSLEEKIELYRRLEQL